MTKTETCSELQAMLDKHPEIAEQYHAADDEVKACLNLWATLSPEDQALWADFARAKASAEKLAQGRA